MREFGCLAVEDGDIDLHGACGGHLLTSTAWGVLGCEQVFHATGNSALGHSLGLGIDHGVVADGFVEDGRLVGADGMLLGEWSQFGVVTLDEATGLQELVDFLWNGLQTCCTNTIAGQNIGFGLTGGKVLHAGVETTAAEGAERHDLLAAEVDLLEECLDGWGVGAEPDGVAEEDDVVARNSRKLLK